MDSSERERLDRIEREAEAERTAGDPRPVVARNARPLAIFAVAALVVAVIVIGVMYVRNNDGTRSVPVAQGQEQTPTPTPTR